MQLSFSAITTNGRDGNLGIYSVVSIANGGKRFHPNSTNYRRILCDNRSSKSGIVYTYGGKIDYIKLRAALEKQAATQFGDCWFFDHSRSAQQLNPGLTGEYHMLKFAPPDGPQVLSPMSYLRRRCLIGIDHIYLLLNTDSSKSACFP
ncbi:hypothetical protein PsorP6_004058 [Peronosclerospora sorghi]|uniref:Uncharacterized protein n=1 Tax=Peronosclerospora sorghi TaxID=230839 RepID=A0ACC0VLC6_9STRA|nr:hypothetical protein PsorP6_004058 [Peronosclerospora sorghi]